MLGHIDWGNSFHMVGQPAVVTGIALPVHSPQLLVRENADDGPAAALQPPKEFLPLLIPDLLDFLSQ